MLKELDQFYLNQKEPNKSCLLALRDIILKHDDSISATRKYGMPCFCYNSKILCYLWTDKKTSDPYILVARGNELDHPMLEKGSRAKMKIFRVNPNADIPIKPIQELLNMAIKLY